ncbi:MAG: biliverdin-producing heme oxygenase, partial [Chloroflexaceae bacterium]|nr:biliverdin-producing heme oxygenase [Chloroflexaceae bacterium]
MTIMTRLKQETQASHDGLELQLSITTRCTSREAYGQLLACFYGFYMPLERALNQLPELHELELQFAERQKTPLLERDLAALGLSSAQIAALPRCTDLPQIHTAAAGLGCMYVMEGATLGGQLISRQLAQQLAIGPEQGGAFFASYGSRVGPMWRAFGAAVTSHVAEAADEEAACAAACAT